MRLPVLLFCVAFSLTLTGCITFIDVTKPKANTVRIDGTGNSFTTKPGVYQSVLRRAAELAAKENFRYFTIVPLKPFDPFAIGNITLSDAPRVSLLVTFVAEKTNDDPEIYDGQYILANLH